MHRKTFNGHRAELTPVEDGARSRTKTLELERLASLPEVLRVTELAAFLRMNRKTVYAAIEAGEIPGARRVGRAIRVSRDAVVQWLRGQAATARRGRGE